MSTAFLVDVVGLFKMIGLLTKSRFPLFSTSPLTRTVKFSFKNVGGIIFKPFTIVIIIATAVMIIIASMIVIIIVAISSITIILLAVMATFECGNKCSGSR